ncbi:unnamed protein product, partial [Mesorhabditis belari]|uniref:ET module n=1 Tax=Mesorhabditis belari TaxID=2138241 RepID=A0AAF3FS73_9BILA
MLEQQPKNGVCNTVTASLLDGERVAYFWMRRKGVLCGEDLCNTLLELGLPTFDEIIEPLQNLTFTCYVGLKHGMFTVGGIQQCDGACGTLQATANGLDLRSVFCAIPCGLCAAFLKLNSDLDLILYSCDPATICRGYGLNNKCDGVDNNTYYGCCCDTDACIDPTRMPPVKGFYCAQRSFCQALDTVSRCDTTSVGDQILLRAAAVTIQRIVSIRNRDIPTVVAKTVMGVISGCCCDSDVCINPYNSRYPNGNNSLSCFVGVTVGTDYMVGGSMPCDGECGSLETTVNGMHAAGYFCASRSLCKTLGVHNDCASDNNCNAIADNVTVPTYVPQNRPPLACYNGLSLNNQLLQDGNQYMACRGDYGSITFSATVAG